MLSFNDLVFTKVFRDFWKHGKGLTALPLPLYIEVVLDSVSIILGIDTFQIETYHPNTLLLLQIACGRHSLLLE